MEYKGVIFDLDGTLLNSIEDLADSMNIVLEKYQFPTHEIHDYEEFIGNGILNLVKKALPESERDDNKCMKYFDIMFNIYGENCTTKTKPYTEIAELLDQLVSKNIKLAILSNKADALTKKAVDKLLPNWNFESVEGLSSENTKKPNPVKAIQISKLMGLDQKEIIFVGDSGVDMQTAVNANMTGIGVLWGFRKKKELVENGAKHIIKTPLELLDLF